MKDGLFDDTGNIVAASRMYMPGWMDRYVAFVKRHTGWNGRRGEPLVRRRRITPQPSIDSASCSVRAQVVIAPSDAEFTSRTYLLSTPRGTSRGGRVQRARRASSSAAERSTSSVRFSASMVMRSSSCRIASGPPTAASGETWPTTKP